MDYLFSTRVYKNLISIFWAHRVRPIFVFCRQNWVTGGVILVQKTTTNLGGQQISSGQTTFSYKLETDTKKARFTDCYCSDIKDLCNSRKRNYKTRLFAWTLTGYLEPKYYFPASFRQNLNGTLWPKYFVPQSFFAMNHHKQSYRANNFG